MQVYNYSGVEYTAMYMYQCTVLYYRKKKSCMHETLHTHTHTYTHTLYLVYITRFLLYQMAV